MIYRFYRFMYGVVGFSRSQTNGFLLLLPLVFLTTVLPTFYRLLVESKVGDHSQDVQRLEAIIAQITAAEQRGNRADSVTNIKPFDPNTASQSDLEKAGISPVVARRMVNFVSKGGRFRSRKDLLRIYGFDTLLFHRIEAKIVISPVASGSKGSRRREFSEIGEGKVSERQQDLNQADTADLKRVKGIGDKLSLRIVRYRDALGGFVSLNQLKEIYKLDSSVIKRVEAKFFISPDFEPVKLNINTAERQILAVHPYISDKAATAIVAYRFQHGEYKMLEDLRHIPFIDSIMFRKTLPYLKLTD